MANTLRKYGAKYNTTFCTFAGLSTDTKPVGAALINNRSVALANGSEFIEMDTDKKYSYDAENQQWNLASSGGGGGGSATLIEKSITENGTYNASSDNADGYSKVTVDVSGGGFNFITTPIATLDTNNTMYFYNLRLYTSESGVYDLAGGDSVDLYDHFYVLINPLVSFSDLSAIPGGAIIAFTPDDNFNLGSGVELSGDTITNGDGLGYVIRFWRTGTLTGTVYKIVDNHSQQIVWDDNVIIR